MCPNPGSAPHLRAEIAFLVEEDYQGQGIARCLLDHLVRIACARGCHNFTPRSLRTTGRC